MYHFESGIIHTSNNHRLRCLIFVTEIMPSAGVVSLSVNGVSAVIAREELSNDNYFLYIKPVSSGDIQ